MTGSVSPARVATVETRLDNRLNHGRLWIGTMDAFASSDAEYIGQEAELVAAFSALSNINYMESPLSKDWPEGMLEKINAL
ncbi:hypothetical protein [Mesorhizobium sp. KR2-14]|uniref:hypothetical protein n=1 Tax=Mesorhizobium sp. KR2-14 TaxID=3156610 RepID=UPI0032B5CFA1